MLMHWFPGAGDPLDWPLDRFDKMLEQISRIERLKRGDPGAAAADERERWLKRVAQGD